MPKINSITIAAIAAVTPILCSAPMASADQSTCDAMLQASFIEGAPRDNFQFENTSNGAWEINTINIDLADSDGKLVFDTENGGTGVEVFQPYKTEAGDAVLSQVSEPADGGKQIILEFSSFPIQRSFRFSIDVDDTLARSDLGQIRVTGGELNGAKLTVTFTNADDPSAPPIEISGTYTQRNKAAVQRGDC